MKQRVYRMVLRTAYARAVAFTLLEVLVAVAALALLAVGVAAIFDTTGKTVQAGRRVSAFSSYAALIEQQLRQDIASMTREGFLVIRNQCAADGPLEPPYLVPLHSEDFNARPRRIDELLFFAKGDFRSARELLAPGIIAQSDSARIYYGHGTRRLRNINPNQPYLRPKVHYRYEGGLFEPQSLLGYNIPDNPNRYASDWTLLRHVTLLRQPRTTGVNLVGLPLGISANQAIDSDIQIGLQPAASSIFRSLSSFFPAPLPGSGNAIRNSYPAFASGLVDIATTDLAEIRSIIETADAWPNTADTDFYDPNQNNGPDGNNVGVDGLRRRWGNGAGEDPLIIQRMHAWMEDAFPANSMGTRLAQSQTRIRYEPSPNNYVGIAADTGLNDLQRAFRRGDQLMLASSNFLPRCTEFIVEWSTGATIPSDLPTSHPNFHRRGEVIWYGMERQVNGQLVAAPYSNSHIYPDPQVTAAWRQPMQVSYTRVNGQSAPRNVPFDPTLIHSPFDVTGPNQQAITSYFGWTDPTFDPEEPNRLGGGPSTPHNGLLDENSESSSPTIQWPWPKMIRITLSLADPRDPSIEQTFQFVFDVPAGRDGR